MPPSPQIQQAITDALADRLNRAIDDYNNVAFDTGEFFKGPAPAAAPLLPQWAAGRSLCRAYARGGVGVNPVIDQTVGSVCAPFLEDIDEAPIPGSAAAPFSGGQCAGTTYAVSGSITTNGVFCSDGSPVGSATTDNLGSFVNNLVGPVTRLSVEFIPGGECRGAPTGWGVRAIDQGGARSQFFQVNPTNGIRNFTSASIGPILTPISGPDNCGDPPPEYTAPRPRPGLDPFQPTAPIPGTDDDLPINIDFNPDGTIDINVDGWDPTVTIGGGGDGGSSGPPPGDQGNPGDGATAGEEPAEGEAPPGSVLVGLLISSLIAPEYAQEIRAGVFRGAGFIRMGGDVGLDLDPAGATLSQGQFIYAEKDNLTRWRVNANVGYQLGVTPYYREVEE